MGLGLEVIKVTILSGTAVSDSADLRFHTLRGVILPSAWTAADLSFQFAPEIGGGDNGATYGEVFLDPGTGTGTAFALDAAANQATFLTTAGLTVGGVFLKVRSGPSGGPVNQAADRVIRLLVQRGV